MIKYIEENKEFINYCLLLKDLNFQVEHHQNRLNIIKSIEEEIEDEESILNELINSKQQIIRKQKEESDNLNNKSYEDYFETISSIYLLLRKKIK